MKPIKWPAETNAKSKHYLQVGSDIDGTPLRIPVLVIKGARPGPTLWVQGCVHGEEYGGAAAIIRLFQGVEPERLAGTLVMLPVVNLPSFKAHNRISPLDGADLNRAFPGDTSGSYSQRLAAVLLDSIVDSADYLIDLHSGGITAEVPFYAIYHDDGSETAAISSQLARHAMSPVVWRTRGKGGTISRLAVTRGVPTVTIECGGGNITSEQEASYVSAVSNILKYLGMMEGRPVKQEAYKVLGEGAFVFTREGGLFIPECRVGEMVTKGQLMCRIMNLYGDYTEELRSPIDGFVAAMGLPYYPVEPGYLAYEVIAVEETF